MPSVSPSHCLSLRWRGGKVVFVFVDARRQRFEAGPELSPKCVFSITQGSPGCHLEGENVKRLLAQIQSCCRHLRNKAFRLSCSNIFLSVIRVRYINLQYLCLGSFSLSNLKASTRTFYADDMCRSRQLEGVCVR